eukprot:PhM_4_TR2418/c6_g1_i1/m.74279
MQPLSLTSLLSVVLTLLLLGSSLLVQHTKASTPPSTVSAPTEFHLGDVPTSIPILNTFPMHAEAFVARLPASEQSLLQELRPEFEVLSFSSSNDAFQAAKHKVADGLWNISVVFIAQEPGDHHGVVELHTTFGTLTYPCSATTHRNKFRVNSVNQRVVVGTAWRHEVVLYNPETALELQIREVYTSDTNFLVSLPDSARVLQWTTAAGSRNTQSTPQSMKGSARKDVWTVRPRHTATVVFVELVPFRTRGTYTTLLHIKTLKTSIITQITVTVTEPVEFVRQIDLGLFTFPGATRSRKVYLKNRTPHRLMVRSVRLGNPHDPMTRLSVRRNIVLREDEERVIGELTMTASIRDGSTRKSGVILIATNASVAAASNLEVRYNARVEFGTVMFSTQNISFFSGSHRPFAPLYRTFRLHHSFAHPLRVLDFGIPNDSRFETVRFVAKGALFPNNTTQEIATLRFFSNSSEGEAFTSIQVRTNLTTFRIPIWINSGHMTLTRGSSSPEFTPPVSRQTVVRMDPYMLGALPPHIVARWYRRLSDKQTLAMGHLNPKEVAKTGHAMNFTFSSVNSFILPLCNVRVSATVSITIRAVAPDKLYPRSQCQMLRPFGNITFTATLKTTRKVDGVGTIRTSTPRGADFPHKVTYSVATGKIEAAPIRLSKAADNVADVVHAPLLVYTTTPREITIHNVLFQNSKHRFAARITHPRLPAFSGKKSSESSEDDVDGSVSSQLGDKHHIGYAEFVDAGFPKIAAINPLKAKQRFDGVIRSDVDILLLERYHEVWESMRKTGELTLSVKFVAFAENYTHLQSANTMTVSFTHPAILTSPDDSRMDFQQTTIDHAKRLWIPVRNPCGTPIEVELVLPSSLLLGGGVNGESVAAAQQSFARIRKILSAHHASAIPSKVWNAVAQSLQQRTTTETFTLGASSPSDQQQHSTTLKVVLPAFEEGHLGPVVFRPSHQRQEESIVFLRSNYTFLEPILVKGTGAKADIALHLGRDYSAKELIVNISENAISSRWPRMKGYPSLMDVVQYFVYGAPPNSHGRLLPNMFTAKGEISEIPANAWRSVRFVRNFHIFNSGNVPLRITRFSLPLNSCTWRSVTIEPCKLNETIDFEPEQLHQARLVFLPDFTVQNEKFYFNVHTEELGLIKFAVHFILPESQMPNLYESEATSIYESILRLLSIGIIGILPTFFVPAIVIDFFTRSLVTAPLEEVLPSATTTVCTCPPQPKTPVKKEPTPPSPTSSAASSSRASATPTPSKRRDSRETATTTTNNNINSDLASVTEPIVLQEKREREAVHTEEMQTLETVRSMRRDIRRLLQLATLEKRHNAERLAVFDAESRARAQIDRSVDFDAAKLRDDAKKSLMGIKERIAQREREQRLREEEEAAVAALSKERETLEAQETKTRDKLAHRALTDLQHIFNDSVTAGNSLKKRLLEAARRKEKEQQQQQQQQQQQLKQQQKQQQQQQQQGFKNTPSTTPRQTPHQSPRVVAAPAPSVSPSVAPSPSPQRPQQQQQQHQHQPKDLKRKGNKKQQQQEQQQQQRQQQQQQPTMSLPPATADLSEILLRPPQPGAPPSIEPIGASRRGMHQSSSAPTLSLHDDDNDNTKKAAPVLARHQSGGGFGVAALLGASGATPSPSPGRFEPCGDDTPLRDLNSLLSEINFRGNMNSREDPMFDIANFTSAFNTSNNGQGAGNNNAVAGGGRGGGGFSLFDATPFGQDAPNNNNNNNNQTNTNNTNNNNSGPSFFAFSPFSAQQK